MKVKKRNGSTEEFSVDKINRVVAWACEGLNANPSDILMNAKLQIHNGIRTSKIHEILVNSATNLISIKTTDYQWAAARLLSFYNRKQIFGVYKNEDMPTIRQVIAINAKLGFYDDSILNKWSESEWSELEAIIDHANDDKLTLASYKKMMDSYVTRNRKTKYLYETPQYAFMMIALTLNHTIDDVRSYYQSMVDKKISKPTPIMAGVRTRSKQFASCVLIDVADDIESIYASMHAIGRFISRKAGIGMNFGRWRSVNSEIRGGEVLHTGVVPFLRLAQGAVKSVSQGSVRDGSATTFFPIWHPEIAELLVLKNNKGTDDNRVKNLDYSVQVTGLFWKRMLKNEKISLFSTSDAPALINAWGLPEFDALYEKYEANKKIPRIEIDGQELLLTIATERVGTGRLYIMNIDNVNSQNQFDDKITQSNLCVAGSTKILTDNGEIEIQTVNNTYVNVWNGLEFSNVLVRQTGENQELYRVTVIYLDAANDDILELSLDCTAYHKWYLSDGSEHRTLDLKFGDELLESNLPNTVNFRYYRIVNVKKLDDLHDTFCFTEPLRNMGMFNGILTGNCVEIVEPTSPIYDVNSEDGEIALCNLACFNVGILDGPKTFHLMEEPLRAIVRSLDTVIDIQEYPAPAARAQLKRRSIGVGISNFAYWMAKRGFKWTDERALGEIDELMEHFQYYLIKASMELSKELGPAEWHHRTAYARGIMPFDNTNAAVNELVVREHTLDWESLRSDVVTYGMRNSVLSAQMPVESSSMVTNATNGIEPPRSLVTTKTNKSGSATTMIVPEADRLMSQYTLAWDITSNSCINKIVAIMQKWIDQSISVNHYYNPMLYEDNQIPAKVVIQDIIEFYKLGGKNLYYANTLDTIESDDSSGCGSGGCTL